MRAVAVTFALTLLACCASIASGEETTDPYGALVAQTEPLTPEEQKTKFHLPPGFEIQLVASDPDIRKPINLQFDARGRLWATDSIEYPFPVAEGTPGRDSVKIFEGIGPDGKAAKITTFADGLNIPIGLLPIRGGALVYSIPSLQLMTDDDGDDHADTRTVLYGKWGFNDTHGMCSSLRHWIDGWVYGCHGFSNTTTLRGSDEQEITMQSGNTYRLQQDGSHIEYFTHGQVNPFGLCFDTAGNLYSSDCHTLPLYLLLREAYYPSFGKPHDGLGFGPTLMSHLHGSTGIAGVQVYAAEHFPPEYRGTVFIGNPVTGRVNLDRLEPHGSGYAAIEQPDFLSCDDPWFRPVDVRLGPDGALYIADFYNSIIGHYEVPLTHPKRDRARGRIWRVVYKGEGDTTPLATLDFTRQSPTQLVNLLADANLERRTLATHELVERCGEIAIEPLQKTLSAKAPSTMRVHGMWALERLKSLNDPQIAWLLKDKDPTVREHAVRVLAERPDWNTGPKNWADVVRSCLRDPDPLVRRVSADALARHPDPQNLAPLLTLWDQTSADDTHLIHGTRIALRDQLAAPGMYEHVSPLVASHPEWSEKLADVSLGVHSEASAAMILAYLQTRENNGRLNEFLHYAARYCAPDQLPNVIAYAQGLVPKSPAGRQLVALRALHRGMQERGAAIPEDVNAWGRSLAEQLLATDQEQPVRDGIELCRELKLANTHAALAKLASRDSKFGPVRNAAMSACVALDRDASVEVLATIVGDSADNIPARQQAATELGNMNTDAGRAILLDVLATAPEQLGQTIGVSLASTQEGAAKLFEVIAAGKATARLLQDLNINRRLSGHKKPEIDQRMAELTANLPPADDRLGKLVAARREGFQHASATAQAGKAVFTKVCAACHRIGGEGAKIGPELDGVGIRGLDRVLEDVLDPSRNVDQAFRSTSVVTKDGQALQGLVLREEGEILVMADQQGKEVRVPLADIDDRQAQQLSPMPANVSELISEADFYNLIAYLLQQRAKPAGDAKTPERPQDFL